MTIMNDIRACLDNYLAATPGLPTLVFPNTPFSPSTGQSFIKVTFTPTLRRPAVRGLNPQQRYEGLYSLLICTPEALGSGAGMTLADKILSRLDATTDVVWDNPTDSLLLESGDALLLEGGDNILLEKRTIVSIDYSELGGSYIDSPFYCTPLTVAWYCYS